MRTFDVSRLAAFSDGVFAIAITLIVLELEVPVAVDMTIGEIIQDNLPKIFSWIVSFFALGALWLRHHYIVAQLKCVDTAILVLNLFFLLFVSVSPWTTAIIGAYGDQTAAVVLFSSVMGLAWLAMALMGLHAVRRGHNISESGSPELGLITSLIYMRGTVIALLSVALAFVNTTLALMAISGHPKGVC